MAVTISYKQATKPNQADLLATSPRRPSSQTSSAKEPGALQSVTSRLLSPTKRTYLQLVQEGQVVRVERQGA